MPATLLSQSASAQKLFDHIAQLPLNKKQYAIARRIVSSLKNTERRTLKKVLDSDKERAEKLIINAVKKYECLMANDMSGVTRSIKDDTAILSS